MAQQFDYPKTETQLREIQDKLYQHSKEVHDAGGRPAFKGLLEIMSAEATITTAIHNIKSNRGSETPGVDFNTMRKDYLQRSHLWVIRDIQSAFQHFEPQQIRRKYIDKPGKTEKRPLGIPTIRDRIVQECMRIVLEPIFEAQFFAHSYGFRPMRDAPMALERAKLLVHHTGYYWIVEGDISKCFDRIDHAILLKRLYHMGVRDRRVLQIIKAMLKAGVMLNKRLGAEVDYIVKGIDQEHNVVAGSRLEAMVLKRREYYFRTDRDGNYQIYEGIRAEARVISVIRAGVFVDLFGAECYIPLRELSYQRWVDAAQHYQPGQRVLVRVLEVDRSDRNHPRVTASVKQAMENPYEKALKKYVVGNRYVGTVSMVDLNGVFVSLDGGIDCLCTYPKRGRPPRGARATVRILGINHENNRIWGVITHMSTMR